MIRNLLIVLLTLGGVATLALGVAANHRDIVSWAKRDAKGLPWVWFLCGDGKLSIQHWWALDEKRPFSRAEHQFCGVVVRTTVADVRAPDSTQSGRIPIKIIQFSCPRWLPFLVCPLLLAYPAAAFIRGPLCRWRRRRKGLCVKCGYNLTGNVTGVCPECALPIDYRSGRPNRVLGYIRRRKSACLLAACLVFVLSLPFGVTLVFHLLPEPDARGRLVRVPETVYLAVSLGVTLAVAYVPARLAYAVLWSKKK